MSFLLTFLCTAASGIIWYFAGRISRSAEKKIADCAMRVIEPEYVRKFCEARSIEGSGKIAIIGFCRTVLQEIATSLSD